MTRLLPGQAVSDPIAFDLINGTRWKLEERNEETHPWRMIVVYRGRRCPLCKAHLRALRDKLDAFADAGVAVVASSTDTEESGKRTQADWNTGSVPIA